MRVPKKVTITYSDESEKVLDCLSEESFVLLSGEEAIINGDMDLCMEFLKGAACMVLVARDAKKEVSH